MALRSMSPRFAGALISLVALTACGGTLSTQPNPHQSEFSTKQCIQQIIASDPLLPFCYFGNPYGASAYGLGYGYGLGSLLTPALGVAAPLVPLNYGAIGSALPWAAPGYFNPGPCAPLLDPAIAAPAVVGGYGAIGTAVPAIGADEAKVDEPVSGQSQEATPPETLAHSH